MSLCVKLNGVTIGHFWHWRGAGGQAAPLWVGAEVGVATGVDDGGEAANIVSSSLIPPIVFVRSRVGEAKKFEEEEELVTRPLPPLPLVEECAVVSLVVSLPDSSMLTSNLPPLLIARSSSSISSSFFN